MELPAGVAAHIGARIALAGDRAALACAARCFASVHHAVVEEDARSFPEPEAADAVEAVPAARARERVSKLLRAMPGLRTLRVCSSQHEDARAFLELGSPRTVRFDAISHHEQLCTHVVRDFPGRASADLVYLDRQLRIPQSRTSGLLCQLASVGCLVIPQREYSTYDAGLVDRLRRTYAASSAARPAPQAIRPPGRSKPSNRTSVHCHRHLELQPP